MPPAVRPLPPLVNGKLEAVTWNPRALFGTRENCVQARALLGTLLSTYHVVYLQGMFGLEHTDSGELEQIRDEHNAYLTYSLWSENSNAKGGVAIFLSQELVSVLGGAAVLSDHYLHDAHIIAIRAPRALFVCTYIISERENPTRQRNRRSLQYDAVRALVGSSPGRYVLLGGDQNRADSPHDRYHFKRRGIPVNGDQVWATPDWADVGNFRRLVQAFDGTEFEYNYYGFRHVNGEFVGRNDRWYGSWDDSIAACIKVEAGTV